MKAIIKWFKCKFIDRCSSKNQWQIIQIGFDNRNTFRCKKCEKCVNK